MRLYFITNSIKNSKNANTIQTLNMLKSFNDLDVKVHSFWFVKRIYPSITEDQILIPKIKFGSVVYAFICTTYIKIHNLFYSKEMLVYSRSFYASYFLSFFKKSKLIFEVHSIPNSFGRHIFKKVLESKNVHIISISHALSNKLYQKYNVQNTINVLPDAHPLSKRLIEEKMSAIKFKRYEKIRVGYYGSLKDYKGFSIIRDLILNHSDEFDFIIRSKEKLDKDLASLCKKSGYISHSEAISEMETCNCLLMPLNKTGKFNDISEVTSPLKLFEYLSSGVPVVASDSEVLKEIITHDHDAFLANNYKDFYDSIKKVSENDEHIQKIIFNALETSLKYTYKERANRVLEIFKNLNDE